MGVTGVRPSPPSLKEAVEKDEQDCGADGDVEGVALACETGDTEDDAKNRSCDENQDSQLNQVGGIEVEYAMEDSGSGWEGIGVKVRVVGKGRAGVEQRDYSAGEDDCGCQSNSPAEHSGNRRVELLIGQRFH